MREMIDDPEILAAYNEDALGIKGKFKGLFRPDSEAEVIDIVCSCASRKLSLTSQGLRSSLTGAAISEKGAALSLERMNRLIDIDVEKKLRSLNRALFYPISRNQSKKQGSCMRWIPQVPKSVPWAAMWRPMR